MEVSSGPASTHGNLPAKNEIKITSKIKIMKRIKSTIKIKRRIPDPLWFQSFS